MVALATKTKPDQWDFHPALTKPEWWWVWNDTRLEHALPLWEGAGVTPKDYAPNAQTIRSPGTLPVVWTIGANCSWVRNMYGWAVEFGDAASATTADVIQSSEQTIFAMEQLINLNGWSVFTAVTIQNATEDNAIWAAYTASSGSIIWIVWFDQAATDRWNLFNGSAIVASATAPVARTEPYRLLWAHDDTPTAVTTMFIDGAKETLSTIEQLAPAGDDLGVIILGKQGTGKNSNTQMSCFYAMNRKWTDAEAYQISNDPFGMFEMDLNIFGQGRAPDAAASAMINLAGEGGLASPGGYGMLAGKGGGLVV